jgi:hypothetical protein
MVSPNVTINRSARREEHIERPKAGYRIRPASPSVLDQLSGHVPGMQFECGYEKARNVLEERGFGRTWYWGTWHWRTDAPVCRHS